MCDFGGICGGSDGYGCAFAGGEDVGQFFFNHLLGQVADGAARVGGVPLVGARRVVVLGALEMVAVVRDVIDEVDLGSALFGGVFLHFGGDFDECFVI